MRYETSAWVWYGVILMCLGTILYLNDRLSKEHHPVAPQSPPPTPPQYKEEYLSAAFEAYEMRLLASVENGDYPVTVDESRDRLVQAIGTFCTP